MIRAPLGDRPYWDKWIDQDRRWLEKASSAISHPAANRVYEPQYVFNLAQDYVRLTIRRYSRGDVCNGLGSPIGHALAAWARSNILSEKVCEDFNLKTCRDWDFSFANLNHYNWCFWLVGLALVLEVHDEQWQCLIDLVGGEGEDVLLDRVIASRSTQRRIGSVLLHAKPYGRLLKTIDAPKEQQAALLHDFVDHWYAELKRPPPKNKRAPTVEPYWYIYGDPVENPLEMGSYFGRWCIEAVAAVKAFGLDDRQCLGHEHYPGDLLRPEGPTTHPVREEPKRGLLARWLGRR